MQLLRHCTRVGHSLVSNSKHTELACDTYLVPLDIVCERGVQCAASCASPATARSWDGVAFHALTITRSLTDVTKPALTEITSECFALDAVLSRGALQRFAHVPLRELKLGCQEDTDRPRPQRHRNAELSRCITTYSSMLQCHVRCTVCRCRKRTVTGHDPPAGATPQALQMTQRASISQFI